MVTGALEQAIKAALRFLLARQSEAGYWSDWDLPIGESRIWTTAYVGYRLSTSPQPARNPAQHALDSAAAWLARSEFPEGGWGYNEEVGADADSTALAILFLSSQGTRVPLRSYERLRKFQQPDGGFSTYTCEQSFGAWTASHSDVTAVAIPALLTQYPLSDQFVANAVGYARAQATSEGLWNSYWWNTPLYATEANLQWMAVANHWPAAISARNTLLHREANNAFETALLISCLLHTGCMLKNSTVSESIKALLDTQLSDGSWPSEPILRLSSRDCYEPWAALESGSLFADQHRIFTSATATAALSSVLLAASER